MSRARENANITPAAGRNMVINSAMNVAQRGTSLTMAHDGVTSGYLLDRFKFSMGSNQDTFDGAYSQASDGPDGVSDNSILWTTGTAEAAIAATEIMYLVQTIEAQNCQRLGLGTSASKQVTLTFYVKSSITGTYGVNVYKPDAAGDLTASIVTGTYTISSANTWERKTITFPSGTAASLGITDDNGQGLQINWHLAAGSSYTTTNGTSWGNYVVGKWAYGHAQNGVVTTAGATWGITGVQMEVGPVATELEQELISTTLAKCQRYFQTTYPIGYAVGSTGNISWSIETINGPTANNYLSVGWNMPVKMRTVPTASLYNPTTGSSSASNNIWHTAGTSIPSAVGNISPNAMLFYVNNTAVGANGAIMAHFVADAEL